MHDWGKLLDLWRASADEIPRLKSIEEYRILAEGLLSAGSPLQSLELAEDGLVHWPDDLALACIKGRALARSGSTRAAAVQLASVVTRLRSDSAPDKHLMEEAVGVLARTEKDWAFSTNDLEVKRAHLQRSLHLYREAYEQSGGYWTGINVATLATLLGDQQQGRRIAQQVLEQCLACMAESERDPNAYWLWATLGEASLNLTDWSNAEHYYRQACTLAGRRFGDIRAMQRHVEWLLEHFQQDSSWAKKWLRLPAVAVFTGHMIDVPGRPKQRFPLESEVRVADAIGRWIESNDVGIGFGSAACGGDLMFMEALQARQAETHIILPCSEDAFVESSVEIGVAGNWVARFWRVIENATSVIRTTRERTLGDTETFRHANNVIIGLARIKARELSTDLQGLAVWDGQTGLVGGTAEAVQEWTNLGVPMTRVALEFSVNERGDSISVPIPMEPVSLTMVRSQAPSQAAESRLMYLLFADVVGYSQLNDQEIRSFTADCFGEIAKLIEPYADEILVRQTAGDGIYLAFKQLSAAGYCALAISRYFEETPWLDRNYRSSLRLRTALHAGPIIIAYDAITGSVIGVGAHVNRAARLEPKTPPGQVYASETFAALAALETDLPFDCKYVKQLEWAKRYGTFPTYLVADKSN